MTHPLSPNLQPTINADLVLRAYGMGLFPMAESAEDPEIHWVSPERRGVLPLEGFHIPRRLKRIVRQGQFHVSCNRDFGAVIRACAAPTPSRPQTWINTTIIRLYEELHARGFAHSVECRTLEAGREGVLVGGLYGVALGGVFFGESIFSHTSNAGKVALVHLVARLRLGRFVMLDTQFINDHLRQFGAYEVAMDKWHQDLECALTHRVIFPADATEDALRSWL